MHLQQKCIWMLCKRIERGVEHFKEEKTKKISQIEVEYVILSYLYLKIDDKCWHKMTERDDHRMKSPQIVPSVQINKFECVVSKIDT